MSCQKIISGGQTGVDRAALDAALENKFSCGGWCPAGRIAEDGAIDKKYPLHELSEGNYPERTKKNVEESDGTLIIFKNELTGGTQLTHKIASLLNKPAFLLEATSFNEITDISKINKWVGEKKIKILNVAGPRSSEWPDGYKTTKNIIHLLINKL